MPIAEGLHAVLFEGRNPLEQLADLMSRDPKPEVTGRRWVARPSGRPPPRPPSLTSFKNPIPPPHRPPSPRPPIFFAFFLRKSPVFLAPPFQSG
jgi:hypothetical protein